MTIYKKLKLKNNIFYILFEVEYKKTKDNMPSLCLRDYQNDYYDDGNLSLLLKKVQEHYRLINLDNYDKSIYLMANILYIYEKIPFLSAIKEVFWTKNSNEISEMTIIKKEEIEKYIKNFNIKLNFNKNFKLQNEETWNF